MRIRSSAKLLRNIRKLIRQVCNEIYFLKNGGDVILFVFGSLFFFCLAMLAIGLFILPVIYAVSLLLSWIGTRVLADNIAIIGFLVVGIAAYLFVILHFAEINIRSYREKLPYAFEDIEKILKTLSDFERENLKNEINHTLTNLIDNFQKTKAR